VNGQGKLEGKVAIVTGAGSSGPGLGIGKAISVLFAREGAKVVLVDMDEGRAADTLKMIEDEGGQATVIVADLAERSSIQRIVEETVARHGGIDILVNNAAFGGRGSSLLEVTPEHYDKIIAVNLTAPFMLTKAVVPIMIERGGGSILNITSIAAMRGQGGKGNAAYATAKGGLQSLMVDVADAFGKKGIRVNCIAPGHIDTPMRSQDMVAAGIDPKTFNLAALTALGIDGDGWDIARAALFLAGPDGRFITGVLLPVDGGKTATSH
jgi:NAD(P)-dependent dehydrogenase (short-subunit alcohol dehydrogenase family)